MFKLAGVLVIVSICGCGEKPKPPQQRQPHEEYTYERSAADMKSEAETVEKKRSQQFQDIKEYEYSPTSPRSTGKLETVATAYWEMGMRLKALDVLDKAIDRDSKLDRLHASRAHLLYELGDYGRAQREMEIADKLNPHAEHLKTNMARAMRERAKNQSRQP